MVNAARRQKAPPGTYEGKEYLSMDEAEHYLGIKRSTLQAHVTRLHLQPRKFPGDRRHFLSMEEVKKIEEVIEQPWLGEQHN